jgi:ATP-dependent helicase HrpB
VYESLPQLPITEILPALRETLAAATRAVLEAPPGAGKSTIVPLALDGTPWLRDRKILMLEPRRLAARAVATRMATLLGQPVGKRVGYRTRLDTRVSRETRIEVVTEGILTRMLQDDASLAGIGCVIFDEFHERSIHADLGLALCLESQQSLREDLRILVMSATLDVGPLAALLDGAPVLASQGRSFDVLTEYVPRRAEQRLEQQLAGVIKRALGARPGDLLCFLPGAGEIRQLQRALEEGGLPSGCRVLPLYGDLAIAEQDAAIAAAVPGTRKLVLATSIAETSLTIDGVTIVVDAGLRRYSEFDPETGMSRLVTGKVSQAAADQRRGRAGRLAPGTCYRLWSQGTQDALAAQTPPEILLADLGPLALELAHWGATDAQSLRWLDPPPAAPLAQARDLLRRLDALDARGRITDHGRKLARAGIHPRLAHMLVKSREFGAARLACDLAAILGERDVLRAERGARDVDLRLRVGALRGERGTLPFGISVDARAMSQAKRSAGDWQRQFALVGGDRADPHTATGLLLAHAYPDRIARRRGSGDRYLLANGRGAQFGEPQALAKSEFIVAAELDGAEREARIHLAAPVERADLERHFAEQIEVHADIAWDPRSASVHARRERRLGALVLESEDITDADAAAIEGAMLAGILQMGLEALPWTAELRQWQARVALLEKFAVPAPEPWPDLSDAALLAGLEDWLRPWISGMSRREHLARLDLGNALRGRLSYAQREVLEREAPTHWVVPSGSRVALDYVDGEVPSLSVRLQEMFGLKLTPSIAGGRAPLLLKLLSPAGRPVQITRDLVSFWNRGYHEVKKDLKGRYPKHYWPDDPHAAMPTRRARPR